MNNRANIILLKLIREASGLTQADFARKLGIPPSLLSKFENAVLEPSAKMLLSIAEKAGYPFDFFVQPAFEISSGLIYHRKRASLSALTRTRLEAQARLRAFDAAKIGRENGVCAAIIQREGRTPQEAARELRRIWNLGDAPIDNLVTTLEEHGIFILAFDFNTDKLDGFFVPIYEDGMDESICIALNTNAVFTPDRQRFTLAHELGHVILHRKEFPDPSVIDFESEANAFAAEFLMPEIVAKTELSVPLTFTNLRELKIRWHLSMSALAFRAKEIGATTATAYKRTLFFLQSSGYRKKEPTFGLAHENSHLFKCLVEQMIIKGKDPDDILHLGIHRLKRRYPDIMFPGGMT